MSCQLMTYTNQSCTILSSSNLRKKNDFRFDETTELFSRFQCGNSAALLMRIASPETRDVYEKTWRLSALKIPQKVTAFEESYKTHTSNTFKNCFDFCARNSFLESHRQN